MKMLKKSRDFLEKDIAKRVEFIGEMLSSAHADGVVFGNSGGKDCALAGILCKMATDNVLSVMMPCSSARNFESDLKDAIALCQKFKISHITCDLSGVKDLLESELGKGISNGEESFSLSDSALSNVPPRLRMTTLYAVAQSKNYLVVGTGNRSERFMGYFTKWGDGACDFNPISDLTVHEVYQYLEFLEAPSSITEKAPSAGLYDGQTDESDMGVSYTAIDRFLLKKETREEDVQIIEKARRQTLHKVKPFPVFREVDKPECE